jgi:hypothetical protein
MKKIISTLGFLTLTACALQATDRVDGRFYTDIRPERLVTPSEPFAADYVRPPKILFLVPGRTGGREVAELKQRFNFTFDAVLYQGPSGVDALGDGSMYIAPIAGALQSEKLEKLNRLLDKEKWDVIVFGHNTRFSGLSPRAQEGVLKQVAAGAGLVIFQPRPQLSGFKFPKEFEAGYPASGVDEKFPGVAPAEKARLLAELGAHKLDEVLPGVPVAALPPYQASLAAKGGELVQMWNFGKGKVVWMNSKGNRDGNVNIGWHSLTPYMPYALEEEVYYGEYLSAAAKAILAATPSKAPRVVPAAGNPRSAEIADGRMPAKIAIGKYDLPEELSVKGVIRSVTGDRVELPEQTLPAGKETPLSLEVPALPSGDHFLNYRLISKAGTEYWGTLALKVAPAGATIAQLGTPGEVPKLQDKAKGLTLPVKLAGDSLEGLTLRYAATDRDGREIMRGEQPVKGADNEIKGGLELATGIPHVLRVELWQGNRCLQVANTEFFVGRPMPEFVNLVWGSGFPTVLGMPMMSQLRKAGFNTFMMAGDAGLALVTARGDAHTMDMCFGFKLGAPSAKEPDASFANPEFFQKKIGNKNNGPKKAAGPFKDYIHIYNLGDENGFSYSRPIVAPSELKAFQEFLKEEYAGDLALLNKEWKSSYATFEEITVPDMDKPISMDGIPWKHLWMRFVEKLYADVHHRATEEIRKNDPDPKKFIGAEGSMMGDPEMTLPGLTMWGPYPSRLDNALMRSFGSPDLLRGNWWGGYLAQRSSGGQPLWEQVLGGGVNASFYFQSDGGEGMIGPDLSFTDFFEKEQWPVMLEVNAGVGPLLAHLPPMKSGLGIFFSRPSDQAQSVDVRFGSGGSTRDGLLTWAEAAGIPAFFYSSKQIGEGKLPADGVKILFLPQALCVDDATAKNLAEWVEKGGTVVADIRPGLRNQRGALRESGVLDNLFGVAQDMTGEPKTLTATIQLASGGPLEVANVIVDAKLKAVDAKPQVTTSEGVPLVLTRDVGKGKVILLNFSLGKALANQLDDPALGEFMKGLLAGAGVDTTLEVPTGYIVSRFQGDGVQFLSCRINTGAPEGKAVRLGRKMQVYDVRLGKDLGLVDEIIPSSGAGKNSLYTLSEQAIPAFDLKMSGKPARGKALGISLTPQASQGGAAAKRFYRLSVFGPDGIEQMPLRDFQWAKGPVTFQLPLAWNFPVGSHRVEVTDILTGQKQSLILDLSNK